MAGLRGEEGEVQRPRWWSRKRRWGKAETPWLRTGEGEGGGKGGVTSRRSEQRVLITPALVWHVIHVERDRCVMSLPCQAAGYDVGRMLPPAARVLPAEACEASQTAA